MTVIPVLICESSMLAERGKGLRFPVIEAGVEASGFVVRFKGVVYGYLNRCAHVPMELDWAEGEFFDTTGLYLMCATHGAVYEPESGRCAGGPCRGGRLQQIVVTEQDSQVFWHPDKFLQPPGAEAP
jgi:nitrite reductase/ring-hydroxylating ferredoxin subunit